MIASFVLPGDSWQEIEALPQQVRWTVQRANFHLLDEPVPTLADPFPMDDPLPGAYELHLPSDGVTIWYVVAPYQGREIISIQLVRLDTWVQTGAYPARKGQSLHFPPSRVPREIPQLRVRGGLPHKIPTG